SQLFSQLRQLLLLAQDPVHNHEPSQYQKLLKMIPHYGAELSRSRSCGQCRGWTNPTPSWTGARAESPALSFPETEINVRPVLWKADGLTYALPKPCPMSQRSRNCPQSIQLPAVGL